MDGQEKDRTGWHREAVSKNPTTGAHSTPTMRHKWQRILAAFLMGQGWHALAAARELHTTCLHSDVAGLEARGVRFHRERITVDGYGGSKASVVRYSLLPESYAHARALLGVATLSSPADSDAVREYRRASGG